MDRKWTSFAQALLFHVRMVISFDGSYVGTPVKSVRSVVLARGALAGLEIFNENPMDEGWIYHLPWEPM